MKRWLLAGLPLLLALTPAPAYAMPPVVAAIAAASAFEIFTFIVTVLSIGSAIYGAEQAKKKARREAERQRQAHNNGLQDRTITRVVTDAPHRTVYGRARVGSDIVAIFTSGTKDEFKYLVCVHAAHDCDGVEDIYISGKRIGALDGSGYVTAGSPYFNSGVTASVFDEPHAGTPFTLAHVPVANSLRVLQYIPSSSEWVQIRDSLFTLSGANVTVLPPVQPPYRASYEYVSGQPYVRVITHLGGASDPADAVLVAATSTLTDKWLSTSTLRGFCYSVVVLDLNNQEFQSGIPPVEVLLRGKKLYDPRNGLTAWSANPALAIYDYLIGENCGVAATDLPLADYITAANVCDEDIGAGVKRYTINGTVNADQDPRKTLESLAECMAGGLVGTTWQCWAGKYVAPVLALDQSDIVGALAVMGGTPDADLYNGVRGQYIGPEKSYVMTDVEPWQSAVYVAADGRPLWTDIDFPFTDSAQRIHNLARIFCEDQRNGFTIKATFSLKTWSLKVGQRVTFTSAFLGQTAKIYRVTDKRFGRDQAVELTLKEDAASIWDLADAVVVDATPNTNLPDPFTVGLCGALAMTELIYETTGSAGVKTKAALTWTAPADVSVLDYEVEYKKQTGSAWIKLPNISGTVAEFFDIAPDNYDFRVRARNYMFVYSNFTEIFRFEIVGLLAPPGNVTNFSVRSMAGMALATWDRTLDLDVKIGGDVVIRHSTLTAGASWEAATIVPDGQMNGDATSALLPLATGTYFAKFVDSSGKLSVVPASFVATEAVLTGFTTVATSTQHPLFSGIKTGCVFVDDVLKLDSVTILDDMLTPTDDWSYLDSLGGLQPLGIYNFDAVLNFGTIASRRFHARIVSLAFNAADLLDERLSLMDDWADLDGSVIDDTTATVYASISNDNIAYSGWTPFMVADFNCQYAKFKAELLSADPTHNIQISELSVTVKLPI